MSDEELALEYIDGNNSAFDLLLSRNETKLFSYILFMVRDRHVAEDVFQDTFVKIIVKLNEGKYRTTGKFSAWAMRIAHNVIMDRFREQKVENVVETDEENDMSNISLSELLVSNAEDSFVRTQVLRDVEKIMNKLPDSQREVVYMRFYQNLSFREIAEIKDMSINTALGRMRYAVINMRKMAREYNVALQME